MGQPPRKWLKPRRFFNSASREVIRAKLAAFKADHGGRGNPWLADRIADQVPPADLPEQQTFRKSVHRFMQGRIWMDDRFVELIARFAEALPYHSTPSYIPMKVELVVNDRAEAIIFHSVHFPYDLSWLEFDADIGRLSFVMRSGAYRDTSIMVKPELARY